MRAMLSQNTAIYYVLSVCLGWWEAFYVDYFIESSKTEPSRRGLIMSSILSDEVAQAQRG